MPRDHARHQVTTWDDDDFRQLTPEQQAVYWALTAFRDMSYCGVIAALPKRLSKFSVHLTPARLEELLHELAARRFVVWDEDEDELLIRSYVRWDGVFKVPNVAKGTVDAVSRIRSPKIREAVMVEITRAWIERTETDAGWSGKAPSEEPGRHSVKADRPDFYREVLDRAAELGWVDDGKGRPIRSDNSHREGSAKGYADPSPNPTPDPQSKGSATPFPLSPYPLPQQPPPPPPSTPAPAEPAPQAPATAGGEPRKIIEAPERRVGLALIRLVQGNGNRPATLTKQQLAKGRQLVDEHGEARVMQVIEWAQADPHWHTIVLGLDDLHRKWPQLTARMNAEAGGGPPPKRKRPTIADAYQRMHGVDHALDVMLGTGGAR